MTLFHEQGITFDRVFSSPLIRAHKTAEIMTRSSQHIETIDALVERRLGKLTGLTVRQVRALHPELSQDLDRDASLKHLRESFNHSSAWGIEGYDQVIERLRSGMQSHLEHHTDGERYLIVAHKHTNRAMVHWLLQRGKQDEYHTTRLKIKNAHSVELAKASGIWKHVQGIDPWPYAGNPLSD